MDGTYERLVVQRALNYLIFGAFHERRSEIRRRYHEDGCSSWVEVVVPNKCLFNTWRAATFWHTYFYLLLMQLFKLSTTLWFHSFCFLLSLKILNSSMFLWTFCNMSCNGHISRGHFCLLDSSLAVISAGGFRNQWRSAPEFACKRPGSDRFFQTDPNQPHRGGGNAPGFS